MSNINVTKSAVEPDNLPASLDRPKHPRRIPEGLTPLVLVIIVGMLAFWLIGMVAGAIWCNVAWYGVMGCTAFTIATFWPLGVIGAIALVSIIGASIHLVQSGINASWLDNLGLPIHRADIRHATSSAYGVALERAKSEATRGIDTYSPSYSNTTAKEPVAPITDKDPLVSAKINIEDIFNYKED